MSSPPTAQPPVRAPAEWEPNEACWLAFPYREEHWPGQLEVARDEHAALARAIADPDPQTGRGRGERIELLVASARDESAARRRIGGLDVRYRRMRYGDSWTRDTLPTFVEHEGRLEASCFAFDGWGGKYRIPGDADLARRVAGTLGLRARSFAHVVEGGAVDVDGEGTCLASRGALLPPQRNPRATEAELEATLRRALGVTRVLWVGGALAGDHTDGHVDTLARFVAPAVVACTEPDPDDPNRDVLRSVMRELEGREDARGRRLRIAALPSPGRVDGEDGRPLPASYCNFYVGNRVLAVPAYDGPNDGVAAARLAELFPGRRPVSVRSRATLTGGGSFHCITRQQPRIGAGAVERPAS